MIVKTLPIKIETEIEIHENESYIGWKFKLGDDIYGEQIYKTEGVCLTTEVEKLVINQAISCLSRVLESKLSCKEE